MITHPAETDITLDQVLNALADGQRRAILTQIGGSQPIMCSSVAPELPRSSVSVHLRKLREAGLILQERQGQLIANRLREDVIDTRFPGLLAAVFGTAFARTDSAKGAPPARSER